MSTFQALGHTKSQYNESQAVVVKNSEVLQVVAATWRLQNNLGFLMQEREE